MKQKNELTANTYALNLRSKKNSKFIFKTSLNKSKTRFPLYMWEAAFPFLNSDENDRIYLKQ